MLSRGRAGFAQRGHFSKEFDEMVKNEITIREMAAARLLVYGLEKSPARLYQVAHPGALETVAGLSDLPATASRWLRSKKIQAFIETEQAALDAKREKDRKRIEAETLARIQSAKEGTQLAGHVDYSVPANQLRKLNELINSAGDPSEALDALKVLISKQNELAPEKRTERPIRAYVPITCTECPLYAEAKAKIAKQ